MSISCSDYNLPNLPFCFFGATFSSLCRWILLPINTAVTCITLFLCYRVPCNDRLPFSLVDCNNFIMCLTYIKFYYFLDAGSWRQNAVTHDLTDLNGLTDSLVVTLSTDLLIFPLFELLMSGSTKL